MPDDIRTKHKDKLVQTLVKYKGYNWLHEHEINHIHRLIDYLDVVKTPHSEAFDSPTLHNDFKLFYKQYDLRRGKDFIKTFPNLADWYQSL